MSYSYSQSSSSEASFSDGCAEADGDWGVPTRCFCGSPVLIEVSTIAPNKGRKYFKCAMSEVPRRNGRPHINKCWELAMEEEVEKLQHQLQRNLRSSVNAFASVNAWQAAEPSSVPIDIGEIRSSIYSMREEIDNLKVRLTMREAEIDKLKMLLAKWT